MKLPKWFKTRMDIANIIIRLSSCLTLEFIGWNMNFWERGLVWAAAFYLFIDTLIRIFGGQPLVQSEQNLQSQKELKRWKKKKKQKR